MRVPFPHVETAAREARPALVVSKSVGENGNLFWALMITSAENRGWPGDISLEADHARYGLPIPSLIRTAKIAAFERASASRIGRVDDAVLSKVRQILRTQLAL